MNCRMPSVLKRILRAAWPKNTSGRVVAMPVPAIRAACGQLPPKASVGLGDFRINHARDDASYRVHHETLWQIGCAEGQRVAFCITKEGRYIKISRSLSIGGCHIRNQIVGIGNHGRIERIIARVRRIGGRIVRVYYLNRIITACNIDGQRRRISTAIAIPAAMAFVRYDFPGKNTLNTLLLTPIMIPEVILGVALLLFLRWLQQPKSLLLLIVGHVVITLP